jgi:hypothetical protein
LSLKKDEVGVNLLIIQRQGNFSANEVPGAAKKSKNSKKSRAA